jgi:hypothetical protein
MALALGTASGMFGLAATAHAAQPRVPTAFGQQEHFIRYDPYTSPPQIAAENYLICPPPIHECGLEVIIYRLENGSWVEVATGETIAVVYCSGTFSTTYKDQSGDEVTAPCS